MPITTDMVVGGIFFGLMLGAIYSFYNKQVIGRFVLKLLELGASTPENAQSVTQTGHKNNYLLRTALRKSGMLRKIVFEDPDRSGFYFITEENSVRAQRTYGNKSATVIVLVVTLIVLLVVMIITSLILPSIIKLAQSLLGFMSPSEI